MASQAGISASSTPTFLFSQACSDACGPGFGECELPADYVSAFQAAQRADAGAPDSGQVDSGHADAGPPANCPAAAPVKVKCSNFCEGRRTFGIAEPRAGDASLGAYFAACSYLESVSVHAFARLAEELAAHGAPRELVEKAHRARNEETRHAELTAALARGFGAEPETPRAPAHEARSLFAIALENAVEGCVRETYGAALALVRASRAEDPRVRDAMRAIAPDECAHAELSWEIAAWAMPRLDREERAAVRRAMREAADELCAGADDALDASLARVAGMPPREERRRLAAMLDAAVFAAAA